MLGDFWENEFAAAAERKGGELSVVHLLNVVGEFFEQVVVVLHFLAVRSFVVEPVAEAQGGFCLADGNFFKEFEGLADAGAAIADGSVVFDVNKGKWMNEACGALAGIGVLGVGLAQEKDYAGVGVVRGFWMRYGVGADGCGFEFGFVFSKYWRS